VSENIIGYIQDGQIVDTQSAGENPAGEPITYDNSPEALELIRHSTAHLMAQAIKALYPNTQFFVGPVVDEGFYYDFRTDTKIGEEDLKAIEKKMKELIKAKLSIEKYTITKEEAKAKFADDDLKQRVMERIEDAEVSIYKQGDFEDLCRGPHVPRTNLLHHFKLTRVAGAYVGGDADEEMLTRIYGVAFADKESLKAHMTMLEEAKKRDHRKLGTELGLFMFSEESGAGLPFWLPAGARLRNKLEAILHVAHRNRGYEPVRGPEILKAQMWKTSGHYDNYGENMYLTEIDGAEYGIKPMNCIGHIEVFKNSGKSYRDLPLKYYEYGVVHRHEKSGVLHGLLRVREFTQDDAHIFCTPEQIKDEVLDVVEFVDSVMKKFGFEYTMEIATKPAKAIGEDAVWEMATQGLIDALEGNGLDYGIDEGGGAFYGPKIDLKINDALGREWQLSTIQFDFNLPDRFDLKYIGADGQEHRPYMIHRALLGSMERFFGILIEHYGGAFPVWLAPVQATVIPIADRHNDYAYDVRDRLFEAGLRVEVDDSSDRMNAKIRNAQMQKIPYMLVVGDKEVENGTVALRRRDGRRQNDLSVDDFLAMALEAIREKKEL